MGLKLKYSQISRHVVWQTVSDVSEEQSSISTVYKVQEKDTAHTVKVNAASSFKISLTFTNRYDVIPHKIESPPTSL
jgi:hypothetical protein